MLPSNHMLNNELRHPEKEGNGPKWWAMPAAVSRLQGDHHQQQSAREPEIVQHLMITNIDQVQKMIRYSGWIWWYVMMTPLMVPPRSSTKQEPLKGWEVKQGNPPHAPPLESNRVTNSNTPHYMCCSCATLFREALQKTGVNIKPILLRLKDR